MTGKCFGIGIGPGDPELLTLKAARLIQQSPVLAYPAPDSGESLARAIAAPHLPGNQFEIPIVIPMTPKQPPDAVYDRAADEISEQLNAGQNVAVLCEGDPFFYGSFAYLFARLAQSHEVEVIPGVSSLMACATVMGTPLAARNDVLSILPAPLPAHILKARLEQTDAAAIIKVGRHFTKVKVLLDDMELTQNAHYVERATLENQRLIPLNKITTQSVPYFSMILVHKRGKAWL